MTQPPADRRPAEPAHIPQFVGDLLSATAAKFPDRPAVWFKERWHSFGEIDTQVAAWAACLQRCGLTPTDHIAILLPNSTDYIAAHFAVHKLGAVEVSLNVEFKGEALRKLLAHSEARALTTSVRAVELWRNEFSALPQLHHIVVNEPLPPGFVAPAGCAVHSFLDASASDAHNTPLYPEKSDTDLATVVYTSGSTGEPKGVMLSHRNLVSNTRSIASYLQLRPDDRMMVVLPFHYIFGRSLLYTHFLTGGSLVIDNRFAFPNAILDTLASQAATCFAGVPSTFSILLHKTNVRSRRFPHLRLLTQAGGGMAPVLQREVAQVFDPARLYVMYGSTEAAPRLTYVEPEALPRKWGSIGRAIPNVEVAVTDADGCALPNGETGEIVARGPNIMLGYWKDPAGTRQVLRNGLYFTGDLGYADDEGYLFLTGRSKDMIKTGGNRVSPKQIEDTLLEISGIRESAVIGVPDDILGEAINAYVVRIDPAISERHIQEELSLRLPSFMIPKKFVFRDSLPKNSSGKILKTALSASTAA